MKLVMLVNWGDEYSGCGTDTIPFGYNSKEDFEFDYLTSQCCGPQGPSINYSM